MFENNSITITFKKNNKITLYKQLQKGKCIQNKRLKKKKRLHQITHTKKIKPKKIEKNEKEKSKKEPKKKEIEKKEKKIENAKKKNRKTKEKKYTHY